MKPAAIIQEAAADGVILVRTSSGSLRATGEQAAVTRWLPVLAMLEARPGTRYAVLTDLNAAPGVVVVALAIRGRASCELHIPRDKYDGVLLLDLIEKYGVSVH